MAPISPAPVRICIDELQYVLEREPAFASVLQRLWDRYRARLDLHLVVCGSALGTMAALGDEGQPLHGRFDLKMKLRPFTYLEAARFVPAWEPVDVLRRLREHASRVSPARVPGPRRLAIATAGQFSEGLQRAAREEGVLLIGLPELLGPGS